MKKRKNCLEELLLSIYGVKTINRGVGRNNIQFGKSGLFEKCKYTIKNFKNYYELFLLTFNTPDVIFEKTTAGGAILNQDFSKEKAIENAIDYFSEYKADSLVKFKGNISDYNAVSYEIFRAVVCILSHVIFEIDNEQIDKLLNEDDNIENRFNEAIRHIKNQFLRFELFYDRKMNLAGRELITDPVYAKERCNFAVLIDSEMLKRRILIWKIPEIKFLLRTENDKTDNVKIFEFDELTRELTRYFPDTDTVSVNTFWNLSNSKSDVSPDFALAEYSRVRISDVELYDLDIFKNYCYIKYLDEKVMKDKFPDVKSPLELKEQLETEAYEAIAQQFSYELEQYYISVMKSVEDVLSRIFSLDFTALVNCDSENPEIYEEMLGKLNMKLNFDVLTLPVKGFLKLDTAEKICKVLEEAVRTVAVQLKNTHIAMSSAFHEYLGRNSRNGHTGKIKEWMTSEMLLTAIQENETHINLNKLESATAFFYEPQINVFMELKEGLEEYYMLLTDSVPDGTPLKRRIEYVKLHLTSLSNYPNPNF